MYVRIQPEFLAVYLGIAELQRNSEIARKRETYTESLLMECL